MCHRQAFPDPQYSSGAHDIAIILMRWAAPWGRVAWVAVRIVAAKRVALFLLQTRLWEHQPASDKLSQRTMYGVRPSRMVRDQTTYHVMAEAHLLLVIIHAAIDGVQCGLGVGRGLLRCPVDRPAACSLLWQPPAISCSSRTSSEGLRRRRALHFANAGTSGTRL